MSKVVLIAGCGYAGKAIAARLLERGMTVIGLSRNLPLALPERCNWISADLLDPATLGVIPSGLDVVIYAASASCYEESSYHQVYVEGLMNLTRVLQSRGGKLARFIYLSSTGVYSQTSAEWVDESSETAPADFSGRVLLAGEKALLDTWADAVVLRLGGIYGPGRATLIDSILRRHWPFSGSSSDKYVNRIHRDDIAGIIEHLINTPAIDNLYLGVDSEPATQAQVYDWLCERLHVSPAKSVLDVGNQGERSAVRSSSRVFSNKRCLNSRLRSLGYHFLYPSFREGLEMVINREYSVRKADS